MVGPPDAGPIDAADGAAVDPGPADVDGVDLEVATLRRLLWRLPSAVLVHDRHGRLLWANLAARTMYLDEDRPPGELAALDRVAAAVRFPSASAGPEGGRVPIQIVTDAALVSRHAVREPAGDGGMALVFALPPDPRRPTGEAEARLRTMLEHTHDIITVLAEDGTIRYSNPAAGALTGIRGVDANGQSAFEFLHPDDVEVGAAALAAALAGEPPQPVSLRLRFADGGYRPTEVFVDNLLDHPSVAGLVVTVRDITEQKAHEEALQQSERRLRSLVENLSDVIVVLDEDLRVSYATPGIETLIPAPAYTNLGESAFNDIHPDDVDAVIEEITALARRPGATTRLEMRLGSDGDGWRWVEVTAVNRLDDPSVSGLVCTLRDVSDRRAAGDALQRAYEREREAAVKLRELDRLKDEFLATVSHELRTPLTSIAGFTQVLLRDDTVGDGHRSLLERVSRAADDMTAMIETLLDFSRLQAGRVDIDLQPVDVPAAVEGIVDALAHQLRDHEVVLELEPAAMLADPAGLGHILRNLLVNAARYSEPGTRIEVRAEAAASEVVIAVTDQGVGIAPEHRTAVFQHFFQADPGRTGRRGAGVGLNIARRYAQLQGGRLWLESTPGQGSTFSVALPRAGR